MGLDAPSTIKVFKRNQSLACLGHWLLFNGSHAHVFQGLQRNVFEEVAEGAKKVLNFLGEYGAVALLL